MYQSNSKPCVLTDQLIRRRTLCECVSYALKCLLINVMYVLVTMLWGGKQLVSFLFGFSFLFFVALSIYVILLKHFYFLLQFIPISFYFLRNYGMFQWHKSYSKYIYIYIFALPNNTKNKQTGNGKHTKQRLHAKERKLFSLFHFSF